MKKFVFCKKEVEFLGFTILSDGIRPNNDMIDNIRNFPTPTNISGVRAWFGLTEQVAYSFSKASVMLPFKHLLSKNVEFFWGEEKQKAFKNRQKFVLGSI